MSADRAITLAQGSPLNVARLRFSVPDRKLELEEMAAYHGAISPGREAQTGMNVFEPTTFHDQVIEGKAHSSPDTAGFKYNVQFKVSIPPKPAPK